MEPTTILLILTIASGILSLAITFLNYYNSIKETIQRSAGDLINAAEDLNEIGEKKMEIAVEQAYALIPQMAKPFFTKPMLQSMIQLAFDQMEAYAIKQTNKN